MVDWGKGEGLEENQMETSANETELLELLCRYKAEAYRFVPLPLSL